MLSLNSMKQMPLKRTFTLLEVMIALVMIGLIGALTAIQVKKMIDVHSYEQETGNFFIALQEAQALSVIYRTDVSLDFFLMEGKPAYRFSTDEPFPNAKLNQEAVVLAHASSIKFQDSKAPTLHFDIYSGGRIEPRGILGIFHSAENEKARWFDLQRGHLLKFSHRKPAPIKQQVPARPKKVQG